MPSLTLELINDLLSYEDGRLYWKHRSDEYFSKPSYAERWNQRYAGKEAFTYLNSTGYYQGAIFDKRYYRHQIIHFMKTGEWLIDHYVDHKDRDKLNNTKENLRKVTPSENNLNAPAKCTSKTGVRGVYPKGDKFYFQKKVGGKVITGCGFKTIEEAHLARCEA